MHFFICFTLLFTSIFLHTQATDQNCGALKIRDPFVARGQQPQHSNHPGFELQCNNTTTTIHFPSYGVLVVKSISYDTKKLDLLDPKSCVHQVFLNLNLSLTPFKYYYVLKEYSYLNCSVRLPSSFSEIPCLSGSAYHVYTVEPSLAVPNSCRVVKTVPIPFAYSDYLSDKSFGLGLTWGLDGNKVPQEKERSNPLLLPKTEQQTECFTMAHVKVACIAIFVFVAVAALISINIHRPKKLQRQKGRQDQIEVEKLLGDYKALKLERCETRQQCSV